MPSPRQKDVLIRGVDCDAYEEFTSLARSMGVSVGYLVSQAIKVFLALCDVGPQFVGFKSDVPGILRRIIALNRSKRPVFIRHVGRLELSREDLEKAEGPLFIVGVDELIFDPSIDTRIFEEKVLRIVDCGRVVIHRGLDKLAVLAKTLFIREVVEII
ncbi:MAG: hypothetical protein LM590_02040 [Thermofilum sp.]|nr:hypothetical protein [Thermofilum sp.]